jgi:hypothetical protein
MRTLHEIDAELPRTTVATVPIGTARTGEAFQFLNEVAEVVDATTLKEELSPINVGKTLNLASSLAPRARRRRAGTRSAPAPGPRPGPAFIGRRSIGRVRAGGSERERAAGRMFVRSPGRAGDPVPRRPVGAAVLGGGALAREMSGKVNREYHDVFRRGL